MKIDRFHRNASKLGLVFILLCLLALDLGPLPISRVQAAATGFHVGGRSLLDANGNNFIMRGVNHLHTWWPTQTSSFRNIKAKKANTVRVILSSGNLWPKTSASEVAKAINLCKTNKLVCVLTVEDTKGYGEKEGAATLAQAVNYWKSLKSVLVGQEEFVIINIGRAPFGNTGSSGWTSATKNAIKNLRSAGFRHMLMVDAPNWGQDWQFIMRDNAASILESDPDKNTVFSIHMYGVFDTEEKVRTYITAFVNANLPLVIGEFSWRAPDGDPDEDAIMAIAEEYGIGYLGWVWSGNGERVEYQDMVIDFNPNLLTWWGNRIFGGKDGICPTSVQATIYGSEPPGPRKCSITLFSVGKKDGWVLETAETSNTGGQTNANTPTFNLGDDASNRQYRAILHFGTMPLPLPDLAVIRSAQLKINIGEVTGTNPFTTHGKLNVDIKKPYFGSKVSLESRDFQARPGKAVIGSFGSTPVQGWYVASLNSDSFLSIDFMQAIQFRLRFAKDDTNDRSADYAKFYSGNAPAARKPVLVNTYTVPRP